VIIFTSGDGSRLLAWVPAPKRWHPSHRRIPPSSAGPAGPPHWVRTWGGVTTALWPRIPQSQQGSLISLQPSHLVSEVLAPALQQCPLQTGFLEVSDVLARGRGCTKILPSRKWLVRLNCKSCAGRSGADKQTCEEAEQHIISSS